MSEVVLNKADTGSAESIRELTSQRIMLGTILVFAGYYLTAKLGFAFALYPGSISILWLPNSILLAALILTPMRHWWIMIAAAFPAHLASELNSGVPIPMVLSWFLSNSSQALIGAIGIRTVIGPQLRFDSFRHFLAFLAFGVFLAPFLSSFLDIGLVKLNAWQNAPYWQLWRIRFLANVVATLTFVPVIVTWANEGLRSLRAPVRRYLEATILALSLTAVSALVFGGHFVATDDSPSLAYWPLPLLLWAAVRFGPRGTSTALLIVMFLAIQDAAYGLGPFSGQSPASNALSIQWFIIVTSIPLMALAAVIQERERAEEATRRNEEQLAMALDAAQMGTWDMNFSENRMKWSDLTKRIFGVSPDFSENPPEVFYDLVHPADVRPIKSAVKQAITQGRPYEVEFRVLQPDSTFRWVRGKGKVIFDEATGNPLRMIGLNADITSQKRAEEALRESKARLARTEEFSLVMVTHVGLDGSWLKVPPTLCELVGYTESELLATTYQAITHPDDIEADVRQCQRIIRGEIKSFDLEKRYIHKNGQTIWVYLNCSAVEDEQGNLIHFLTYIKDITDQKSAEEALRQSEDRYRTVVESQRDIICRYLPDTTLTYVNDAYCRYFARSREELIGTKFIELLPEGIRSWHRENIESLVRDPRAETYEHEVLLPDGSVGWQQWVDYPVPGPDGTVSELQGIGRDITDRKQAEFALHETAERNRAMLRALPDMVFVFSLEGVFLDYYARDRNSLYTRPETFLGANVRDVLPPELAEKVMDCLRRTTTADEPQVLEYSLDMNGEKRYYEARLTTMDGDKVLTLTRDVTAARAASEALTRSEENLRQSNQQISALAGRLIKAQEAERRRISRQLHDDLNQKIATISVGVSKLKRKLPPSEENFRAELDRLAKQINNLTTDIRQLSHQLHPAVLDHLGLVSALESYISEFRYEEEIDVGLTSAISDEAIPLDVSVCLYRVAVEALRNVARHSGAKSANIVLSLNEPFLRLEVSDSGHGFDPAAAARGSGLGLVSAEERVKLLHGTFNVNSEPGMGTTITAQVPFEVAL